MNISHEVRGDCGESLLIQRRAICLFTFCGALARIGPFCGISVIMLTAGVYPAAAQSNKQMTDFASRSAIVVLGTIEKVGASEEPLVAPTNATVVIKVDQMFSGKELAGDQTGRTATVILSKPSDIKVGTKALFFGNPRFIGKTITISDVGELPVPRAETQSLQQTLEPSLQARRDAPIRARLDNAQMVFRGKVESVHPLEVESKDRRPTAQDEHDPEWQVAMVRVTSAVRGSQNATVIPVVFPASGDIMWFNSPKPKPGDDAVFIGHKLQERELGLLRDTGTKSFVEQQHAVFVTQPFDVLPASEEKRVLRLLEVP